MAVLNINGLSAAKTMLPFFFSPITGFIDIHAKSDLVQVNFFKQKLLFVRDPVLIEELFNLEVKGLLNRDFLYEAKKSVFGNGLIGAKDEAWAQQRRLMQPLFNKDAVNVWKELIIAESYCCVDRLMRSLNDINLSFEMKRLVQKIIFQILFNKSTDKIENADRLIQSIEDFMTGFTPLIVSKAFGVDFLSFLFPFHYRRVQKALQYIKGFIQDELELKVLNPGHDLVSLLIQSVDSKTGFRLPKEFYADEVFTLFFSGQETTVNCLIWFFYCIACHPEIQNKVIEEIASFNNADLMSLDLSQLIMTKAALNEALRLYPPSLSVVMQAIEPIRLNDYAIDPGTTILISLYSTHHHKQLWERPNAFYPEHFLPPLIDKRHDFAYFPFSAGLRNCLGKHLAEMEILLIIVTLLREFRISTAMHKVGTAASVTLKPDRDIWVSLQKH